MNAHTSSEPAIQFVMINVVYHCAGMGPIWKDVVAEQFALLAKVGLTAVHAVHVGEDLEWFLEEAKRHNIDLHLHRHEDDLLFYESLALNLVQHIAANSDWPVLYFHTKGVSQPDDFARQRHRHLMMTHVIERWMENVAALDQYDAVGVNWLPCSNAHWITKPWWMRPHFSGNFWIASAQWLRKLPDFSVYNAGIGTRYASEVWIGSTPGCRFKSLACFDQPFWDTRFNWDTLDIPQKLNLGCWKFYKEDWVNIDLNPEFKADLREDVATLPSFSPRSVNEIYAGHIAEHMVDIKAAFSRWFEVLKPGGILTVAVPDLPGSIEVWKGRRQFQAIDGGPDEGLLQIVTGAVSPDELAKIQSPHYRVFDYSCLALCLEAVGFEDVHYVDSHPICVARNSELGWQTMAQARRPLE